MLTIEAISIFIDLNSGFKVFISNFEYIGSVGRILISWPSCVRPAFIGSTAPSLIKILNADRRLG